MVMLTINPSSGIKEFLDNTQGGFPSSDPLILRGDEVKEAELTTPIINAIMKGKLIVMNDEGEAIPDVVGELRRGVRRFDEDNTGEDTIIQSDKPNKRVTKVPKGLKMPEKKVVETPKKEPEVDEEAEDNAPKDTEKVETPGIEEKAPTKGEAVSEGTKKETVSPSSQDGSEDLNNRTKKDLRVMAKAKGLKVSGTKDELIKRLEEVGGAE